ncbi:hypothetical protein HPP92_027765 [Vanilla planifolia]|uniref:Uncharacterized protein n=1 Tax=Vanilla planifolia TaxID=51239 RepID=A0A835PAL1_VANPL|nr:hypothetical protein HPP92_027765 [Vanilla planifolia]
MPLCCVSAASTSCYSLRTSSSLRVVRCQSSLSSPTNGGGQNGLQTDFPVILVEESPTRMTSIPVLSLKTATGQVKAGDVVRNSLVSPLPDFATDTLETVAVSSDIAKGAFSKIDKSGRFCKPRAARELALMVAYAACLEGSDPLFVFGRRLNAKQVPGYAFDKASLLQYDHMSFAGEPIQAETEEEAEELLQKNEKESTNAVCLKLKWVPGFNKMITSASMRCLCSCHRGMFCGLVAINNGYDNFVRYKVIFVVRQLRNFKHKSYFAF